MDRMVNNIQLTWKSIWMLRTYRTCNSMVGFSKYEFYNKLLGNVTLLRVTLGVNWTQPFIYIYIYIYIYIWLFFQKNKGSPKYKHTRTWLIFCYLKPNFL